MYAKNLFLTSKNRRHEKCVGPLTSYEIERAERKWIAVVQSESFDENFKDKKHPLRALDPWLDLESNVLRVGGRLAKIEDDYKMKHPMILPSNNHFTSLWIRREHRRLMHAGATQTLAQCREEVWIVHGLQEVKKEVRKCVTCNFWNSRACKQKMGELPLFRITQAYPFEHCGTDFTGALIPKEGGKLYVVIFTCAVTRAVHFELVSDMTTEEFVEAFKVFIARRGTPRVCYSDNATTYKAAKKIVEQRWCDVVADSIYTPEMLQTKVQWEFIPPRAPWWGGFWERIVGILKSHLRKQLGRSVFTRKQLERLLPQIEGIVNSRPITHVADGIHDQEPLSPAHFLIGRSLTSTISRSDRIDVEKPKSTAVELSRIIRHREKTLDHFWKRWRIEYLAKLAPRSKWHEEGKEPKVGEIVLISEDNVKRACWPLARIEGMSRGRDGLCRTVRLRMNGRITDRPIQRVHRLEIYGAE